MNESTSLISPEIIGESIIPHVADDSRKFNYLSLRASGIGIREACKRAGVPPTTLKKWRHNDQNLKYWDGPGLLTLRKSYRNQLLLELWSRNFRRVLEDQAELLEIPEDMLTDKQRKAREKIWKDYTPEKLKSFIEVGDGSTDKKNDLYDLAKALRQAESIEIVEGEYRESE